MAALLKKISDFTALFEKGQYIGVDLGMGCIKLASLSRVKKNKYKLEGFAMVELSEAAIIDDEIHKLDEVIGAIEDLYKKLKCKHRLVNIGLSGANTVVKRLQVPNGARDELEDNIFWEFEQFVPFNLEEAEADYSIIHKDSENVDVIAAAAKTTVVDNFTRCVKSADLIVKNVDINAVALANLFEMTFHNDQDLLDQGAILIDFGAQKTTIVVYKNNSIHLAKEIYQGGVLVTEEIQRQLGLSYSEAESLKTMGDESGRLPEEIMPIIEKFMFELFEDIKKVLNFFISSSSEQRIDVIYATGGNSLLPGMIENLEKVLNTEVDLLNPFTSFDINKKRLDEQDVDDAVAFGLVAMGLALRGNV